MHIRSSSSSTRRFSGSKVMAALDQWLTERASGPAWPDCGLANLLDADFVAESVDLHSLRKLIERAILAGWTLRMRVPHVARQVQTEWIGQRWLLVHRSHYDRSLTWTGIVSSRLSIQDNSASIWPAQMEQALRCLLRDRQTWLWTEGTTLAPVLAVLLPRYQVANLQVELPREGKRNSPSLSKWLVESLLSVDAVGEYSRPIHALRTTRCDRMYVSPATCGKSSMLECYPLRDRVTVALSHRIHALSVRSGGTLAGLLTERLNDRRFPLGTIALSTHAAMERSRLSLRESCGTQANGSRSSISRGSWFDRRTVSWYVQPQLTRKATLHCSLRCARRDNEPFQTTGEAMTTWHADVRLVGSLRNYLVHCVRGSNVRSNAPANPAAILDAIIYGGTHNSTPLDTLTNILHSGRVRASDKLLRCGASAVSFSKVPFGELLERRKYQAHLGRWDWEPYGLLVHRSVLEHMGARPVIYGDDDLYEQLSSEARVYFQPARRRSARVDQDHWHAEQEWRLASDLRLHELPPGSVLLFVQYASQAQMLASRSPWPIIWLQADRTQVSPFSTTLRPRRIARTGKN